MGLVVDQDQGLTVTPPRPVALDRNRGEIILENSNSIQCRCFRSYLSISAHDKSQGPVIALFHFYLGPASPFSAIERFPTHCEKKICHVRPRGFRLWFDLPLFFTRFILI